MTYTKSEERLLHYAQSDASQRCERQTWMIWIALAIYGLVSLRIVIADAAHSEYVVGFVLAGALVAFQAIWFLRFRVNAYRVIRKLSRQTSALSAASAVRSSTGD